MIIIPALPTGYSTFCDDVRYETSGKSTLVGVYSNNMIFYAAPPVIVPQIYVLVNHKVAPESVPMKFTTKILFENHDGNESELLSEDIELKSPLQPEGTVGNFIEISKTFRLSSVVLPGAGLLKVRRYYDSDELRLGTLRVEFRSSPTGEGV